MLSAKYLGGRETGNHYICHHLSVKGVDSPGALQSLWNVDAEHLVAPPHDLRLDHAAPLFGPSSCSPAV